MPRHTRPNPASILHPGSDRELPPGSELLIAFTLGLAGWYAIVHLVLWIAG